MPRSSGDEWTITDPVVISKEFRNDGSIVRRVFSQSRKMVMKKGRAVLVSASSRTFYTTIKQATK